MVIVEVSILDSKSLKVKGKTGVLVVDPSAKMPKTEGDCVLGVSDEAFNLAKVEGSRLTIKGAGEYEIGGIKISSTGRKNEIAHDVRIDGIDLLLTKSDALSKLQDKTKEFHVVVLDTNSDVDQSALTAHTPS